MKRNFTLVSALVVGAFLLISTPAEARGRGGRSGSVGRQGSHTGPRGNTGSWQGTSTTNRAPGNWQRQYQGTRSGPGGQSSQVNRSSDVNRTGPNSWQRSTQQSVTGPNGQQRSWQAQGTGNVNKTDNGYQKTYNGTVTNDRGRTTDVNRTTDVTRNPDGSVSRDKSSTYTNQSTGKTWEVDKSATTTRDGQGGFTTTRDSSVTGPNGQALGTGQSTTTGQKGQGTATTGTWTRQNGQIWQYEGQTNHPQAGEVDHAQTVTTPSGQQRNTVGTAKWQKIDGQWVRIYDTQTTTP